MAFARGSLGKYTPPKPSSTMYWSLVLIMLTFSLMGGYLAGIEPTGEWRFFSWHPLLMTVGMVGFSGIGAVTKKLGGYTNTKIHGILGFLSIVMNLAGLYCIFQNKERNGYQHLKSTHAQVGLGVVLVHISLGMAGGIFLHPDFGIDKTNKTIRLAHKTCSRLVLMLSWFTAGYGVWQLTQDSTKVAIYAVPLICLVPFVLM